jgi:aminoglycoside phosphotransferase (APT) family kinase protein
VRLLHRPYGTAAAVGLSAAGGSIAAMSSLDPGLLEWAVRAAAPGAEVAEVRGLRDGGSPWLVRLGRRGGQRGVVLRVGDASDASDLRTEVAALRLATEHRLPAPRLVAAELDGDPPLVLVERLQGSSAIPARRPPDRLRGLGRTAARLHAVALAPSPALPRRDRPIAVEDFAALRRRQPARPLLVEAEERVKQPPPGGAEVFVHGDLWQGNALWKGDTLAGLIDWDCAGAGPPGVDLGSLRCDAALCFGVEAADDVQAGWEEEAGRPAADVAHWDVVAALSTPPDMGWFPGAMAGQGRPDLDQEVLVRRRDAFLRAALDRLDAGPG